MPMPTSKAHLSVTHGGEEEYSLVDVINREYITRWKIDPIVRGPGILSPSSYCFNVKAQHMFISVLHIVTKKSSKKKKEQQE